MRTQHNQQSGFSLVEMIMVIVITGIIGGMVAVFLKAPMQQYMDVARRGELTDIADSAIRRMARDVRTAVPNSVRVASCGTTCVEYLPTKDGGRYRADPIGGGGNCGVAGDELSFATADDCFEIVGTPINFAAGAAPDYIVVGSRYPDDNPPYDTTAAGVLRKYTGAAGAQIAVHITKTIFPGTAELSSQRFDVVDGAQQAVTYACVGTLGTLDANQNGQASLVRYWGYWGSGIDSAQLSPAGIVGIVHSQATLADKISACTIDYDIPNQRFGLLAIRLTLTSGGESVSLYNEIHVNNAP